MNFKHSIKMKVYITKYQPHTHHNKMVYRKEGIDHFSIWLGVCYNFLTYRLNFERKRLLPTPTHLLPSSSTISTFNNSHIGATNIGSSSTLTICVALPSNHKAKVNPPQPTNSSSNPSSLQSLNDSLSPNPLNNNVNTL